MESNSVDLIKKSIKKYNSYIPKVLISGGKDSSVTMYLTRMVNPNIEAIFNNTTLDCADTYRYVKEIENCMSINPNVGFYQWIEYYNFIPTRINRACCDVFKEGSMVEWLDGDEKLLFFMGMRNEESNTRSSYLDEWHNNKWSDNWNAVLPIRSWSELDIWLYTFYRNIPINSKYKKGYARVGCAIACPYANKSTWVLDKYFYPTMRDRWEKILLQDFIENGKACVLNCTKQEYINQCWNSPSFRETATDEVIEEFMEYKNIPDKEIASKYFNNTCCSCGKKTKKDDIALSMKYFGKDINKMFCMKCLSKVLNRDKEDLKLDILNFKRQGCTLF